VRFIFEEMGFEVDWVNQTAILINDEFHVRSVGYIVEWNNDIRTIFITPNPSHYQLLRVSTDFLDLKEAPGATAAFENVISEVPKFQWIFNGSVSDRIPPDHNRTHNHPNGLAIDINYSHNSGTNAQRNRLRMEEGINETRPHWISWEVERALNMHGLQAGYRWENPIARGFFHWSICGT
jgi:hypothetical protein